MGLSGVKRKQRIALDPQNKSWRDDKDKFGYKMLMKMGWQEGKGLGLNADGVTQHLEVKLKTDNTGLGVSKKNIREEAYHQLSSFDNLLRELGRDSERGKQDISDGKSERKKLQSKGSRQHGEQTKGRKKNKDGDYLALSGRVAHRKKFIRNKQVDQYSAEQLKEILGPFSA